MHLVINGSDLGRQRGGNESYLLGLLRGLAGLTGRPAPQVTVVTSEAGLEVARRAARLGGFRVESVGPYRPLPFLLWQQTAILRRLRPDWLVSTFFLPPVLPGRGAVLIHDLSFRAHPEYFPPAIASYMRLLTGLAVRRADRVVALSEFTRGELGRFYPAARRKTAVVHPGVGAEFTPDANRQEDERSLAALGVRRPYLLAVGNIHPRKNLARLLAAWRRLRRQGQPVPSLAWAGVERWDSSDLIRQAGSAGVQMLGFVPAAHLPALYRGAEALVYLSLYEGFGLPPLEAMACGTPILASRTTSLPEAVGDAAVMVDPADEVAIADGLAAVLFDHALRCELRTRGLARAAGFTWTRTAERLVSALEEASPQ